MAESIKEPRAAAAPAFRDVLTAKIWLAEHQASPPPVLQASLHAQIEALTAADFPPVLFLEMVEVLRPSVIAVQERLESRYVRRPLPLTRDEGGAFRRARRLWRALAQAYWRAVPALPPGHLLFPLHRAAVTLRQEHYAHLIAGQEVPGELPDLLYQVLCQAETAGVLREGLADPVLTHLEDSTIAGNVAWVFLLESVDAVGLSAAQLTVADRAFSRWRELATFLAVPDDSPRARVIALSELVGRLELPEGAPRWMDVRPVIRKLRTRMESLEAGESPESLKLGRDLGSQACLALFRQMTEALRQSAEEDEAMTGTLELSVGLDDAFSRLTGRAISKQPKAGVASPAVDHQRMAVFGFDNMLTQREGAGRREVPRENWIEAGEWLMRGPAEAQERIKSPCLAAGGQKGAKGGTLAHLWGVRELADGTLCGHIHWYAENVEPCMVMGLPRRSDGVLEVPAFRLAGPDEQVLIVPTAAGIKAGMALALEGVAGGTSRVTVGKLLERGGDFVRFTCEPVTG